MSSYYKDTLEKTFAEKGYRKIERKPWNVRKGDVFVLVDYTRPPFMMDLFIPVLITEIDTYSELSSDPSNQYSDNYARTAWRFHHRALSPADQPHLKFWNSTHGWNRFDTVEIWRKR